MHSIFAVVTDQSIVSGGRNYVKITSGIGDLSKDVRARVSATLSSFKISYPFPISD